MVLSAGARLGPYEIVALLGAGGMGEVYRARDTRLGRDVAIKVLPDLFAHDPERLARFEREAQVLASLNHPNIAHLYGLDESSGMRALVMELVEGPTLADRIARGPIPLDEALPIARQIVEAFEAAHEQGIVHRDLKPANVKLRPDGVVKVLDFGLAKALDPTPTSSIDAMNSPTMTARATQLGMILGTAAYMAPEQAKGKTVDKRADIWAFGAVLYEMLTGRRAFDADDVSTTLARVIEREPDWNALPTNTATTVRTLLRRCLEKDHKRRLRDIGEARLAIEEARTTPLHIAPAAPEPTPHAVGISRRIVALVAASLSVAVAAVVVAVWLAVRPAPPSRAVTRFSVALPANATLPLLSQPALALSPDGTRLVYVARVGTTTLQMYSRASDQLDPIPIRGTEGGTHPFFSPDGQWVGFNSSDGKLKKVPASGGAAITLCDAPALRGATWASDDAIIFVKALDSPGLWRVSAAGGTPVELTKPDGKAELSHRWPEMLPGGKAVIFTIQRDTGFDSAAIGVLRLDTGERRVLVEGGSHPHYLPSGHLVFARAGVIFAVSFDLRTLQLKGSPIPVVEGVQHNSVQGTAQFAASGTGSIAYVLDTGAQASRALVWVDRRGVTQPVPAPRRNYEFPRLSPDGQRVALTIETGGSAANGGRDIWLYQFARGTLSRLTAEKEGAETSVWTPDGRRLTYAAVSRGDPARQIIWKPVDGSAGDEVLSGSDRHLHLGGWSPRGDALIGISSGTDAGSIWMLQMTEKRTPHAFLQTPFQLQAPTISPDGRWLAYASNDTNRFEVYVQSFPGPGERSQISIDGGAEPVWAKHGRELFYRNGDKMMAVAIAAKGASLEAGTPKLLFEGRFSVSSTLGTRDAWYDVSADGQRFLMLRPEEAQASTTIVMVQDWMNELKRLAPGK